MFQASIEQCPTMWVNADSFEFGDSVLTLQQEWARMDVLLEKCFHDGFAANGIARSEFVSEFTAAMRPGTGFERGYILELMDLPNSSLIFFSTFFLGPHLANFFSLGELKWPGSSSSSSDGK